MIVVDASALLALLLKEPGHEKVTARLNGSIMSAVNLSEVLARLVRHGIVPAEAHPKISALGITAVNFDSDQAIIAASIRETARAAGLGLADCCCLALALRDQLPVLTADKVWRSLGLALDIEIIR
jgi:ribonuclease VapC